MKTLMVDQASAHERGELDRDVRILPKPGNDVSGLDSILIAFDGRAHEPLKDPSFLYGLERTLGVHTEGRVHVPLTWVDGGKILDPQNINEAKRVEEIMKGLRPGELGGYFGIRLSKDGVTTASETTAREIASLIATMYGQDGQQRLLHNYTLDQPAEPIEITAGHPQADEIAVVNPQAETRQLGAVPVLAKVSFA